jgi:hypothetical protein
MIIQAKQRLLSYHTDGEADYYTPKPFHRTPDTKLLRNAHSKFQVFYDDTRKNYLCFYFVQDGMTQGRAEFESIGFTKKLPFKAARMPHISFAKEFSGAGVATQLYLIALKQGISLATPSHSVQAKKLWDRVAQEPGVNSYWFTKHGKPVTDNTKTAIRVLTMETI